MRTKRYKISSDNGRDFGDTGRMSRACHLKPIVHIGPPKTATTSLQEGVIPFLGRPYQIKPDWTKSLARWNTFEPPRDLPGDVIVSEEALGDFQVFPPNVIVERLGTVFEKAVVVFVERDPLDLFYSFHRQAVINAIAPMAALIAKDGRNFFPVSVTFFYENELKKYFDSGRGFFAMIRYRALAALFAERFDVEVIPFDLLRGKAEAFVGAFVDICGGGTKPKLPHANKGEPARIEEMLANVSPQLPPEVRNSFLEAYKSPALTKDREDFIRRWASARNIDVFADAFRIGGS